MNRKGVLKNTFFFSFKKSFSVVLGDLGDLSREKHLEKIFKKFSKVEIHRWNEDFKSKIVKEKHVLDEKYNENFFIKEKNDLSSCLSDVMLIEENESPCFTDIHYVYKKNLLKNQIKNWNFDKDIPYFDYTEEEHTTWKTVCSNLLPLIKKKGCGIVTKNLEKFIEEGLSFDRIPQQRDLNILLNKSSGWSIAPTVGVQNSRCFLNLLAFKVFPMTNYIRPYSEWKFSAEPDIVHEYIGHFAMLMDKDFSSFTQEIGIASLGASQEDIKILGNIYLNTIEFGLVKEVNNDNETILRAIGAGILSSFKELDYFSQFKANYYALDFQGNIQKTYYDYVSISKHYFIAQSVEKMKKDFLDFSKNVEKKQNLTFDYKNNSLN